MRRRKLRSSFLFSIAEVPSRKCLNSLSVLEHPSFEVIIVDDGSTDGTAEICEAFPRIKVIKLDRGGPSRARNVGIAERSGRIRGIHGWRLYC